MISGAEPAVSRGRIPALDGLRGIAALLVVAQHTWAEGAGVGSMGVEIFFVLSGFLIGGILLEAVGTPGWAGHFYLRRTLRIWPLYFAVVAIILATDHAVAHPMNAPAWMLWTFMGNFVPVQPDAVRLSANVLWSIAIEEQFYLLLPAIMVFVDKQRLPVALAILSVTSIGLRWWLNYTAVGVNADRHWYAYHMTFCRLDILCMGVFAAWIHRYRRAWLARLRGPALFLAGVKIGTLAYDPWALKAWWDSLLLTTLESAGSALIILALANAEWPRVGGWLSTRVLVFMGTISYGLYLLHPLVLEALHGGQLAGREFPEGPLLFLTVVVPSIGVAAASWFYFEQPMLSLSARPAIRPAPAGAGQ